MCDEERISELFNSLVFEADYASLGTERYWDLAPTLYMNKIIKYFPKNFLQHKTVVLDCANGAASKIAPELFEHLGAQVIVMHNQPNGYNINERCGAVHTEHLQAEVVHHGDRLGFAFDGDADRVIAVTAIEEK